MCKIENKKALKSIAQNTPILFLNALYRNPLKNISSIMGPKRDIKKVTNMSANGRASLNISS